MVKLMVLGIVLKGLQQTGPGSLDWQSVVQWLATGGAVAVVMWFTSWYLEKVAWWQAISSEGKSLIILGASLAIGLLANVYLGLPAEVQGQVAPYGSAVVLILAAWLASQVAHKADG